jgi:hypothetical protein
MGTSSNENGFCQKRCIPGCGISYVHLSPAFKYAYSTWGQTYPLHNSKPLLIPCFISVKSVGLTPSELEVEDLGLRSQINQDIPTLQCHIGIEC